MAAEADFSQMDSCANPNDDNFEHKKNRILQWLMYWKDNGTFARSPASVLDPLTGKACDTPERCAEVLKVEWAPKFLDVPTNESMMDYFIQNFACSLEDVSFKVSFDEFAKMVSKHKWSSPGPDGVHYVFWALLDVGAKLLWEVRLELMKGVKPPVGFNYALLVFLEKYPEKYSEIGLAPPPLEQRPISLGNTDAKHEAAALALPLVKAADAKISKTQEGFIKGRSLLRNVLRIESFAKTMTLMQQFACMLFLDMAAAFPSMSRTLIFRSLVQMKADSEWIDAVQLLYQNNYHYILWQGIKYEGFEFSRGVEQGCPLSAIIFVYIFDMVVRALFQTLGTQFSLVAAVADDLGLVLGDLWVQMPKIIKIMQK